MKYYAVIDTNVFLPALISKRNDAAAVRVLDAMLKGRIIPLYHQEILAEYDEVLHCKMFHLPEDVIQSLLTAIIRFGVEVFPQAIGGLSEYLRGWRIRFFYVGQT